MKTMYLVRMLGSSRLPLADNADDVMETEDFREYVATHGYHMTDKLAEYASGMLTNADGSSHRWSVSDVRNTVGKATGTHTCGDQAYLANMIYSDFFGRPVQNESTIIEMTKAVLADPDGYDGMVMLRFISDLIGRGMKVDWSSFI